MGGLGKQDLTYGLETQGETAERERASSQRMTWKRTERGRRARNDLDVFKEQKGDWVADMQ